MEKKKLYNYGDIKRDFTYIDDIIYGISLVIDKSNENSKIMKFITSVMVNKLSYKISFMR